MPIPKVKKNLPFRFGDWAELPLSERVRRTRDLLRTTWNPNEEIEAQVYHTWMTRQDLGEAFLDTFSHRLVMMGCACLPRLLTYQPRPSVCRTVQATQLRSRPNEPPRLLSSPFIVEVRKPNKGERLFGDTVALGGYRDHDEKLLVMLGVRIIPEGMRSLAVIFGQPAPVGEDDPAAESELPVEMPKILRGKLILEDQAIIEGRQVIYQNTVVPKDNDAWFDQARRFLAVLGILLDAENSPLFTKSEDPLGGKKRHKKGQKPSGATSWILRHVYLTDAALKHAEPAGPHDEPSGPSGALIAGGEDRELASVVVKGHLKRQRFGTARQDVKWIYVNGYPAHRWISTQPTHVVIGTRGSDS